MRCRDGSDIKLLIDEEDDRLFPQMKDKEQRDVQAESTRLDQVLRGKNIYEHNGVVYKITHLDDDLDYHVEEDHKLNLDNVFQQLDDIAFGQDKFNTAANNEVESQSGCKKD